MAGSSGIKTIYYIKTLTSNSFGQFCITSCVGSSSSLSHLSIIVKTFTAFPLLQQPQNSKALYKLRPRGLTMEEWVEQSTENETFHSPLSCKSLSSCPVQQHRRHRVQAIIKYDKWWIDNTGYEDGFTAVVTGKQGMVKLTERRQLS